MIDSHLIAFVTLGYIVETDLYLVLTVLLLTFRKPKELATRFALLRAKLQLSHIMRNFCIVLWQKKPTKKQQQQKTLNNNKKKKKKKKKKRKKEEKNVDVLRDQNI